MYMTPRAVAWDRPAEPPIAKGLPVTTPGTENPSRVEKVSMIHAMTCSVVHPGGDGDLERPARVPKDLVHARVEVHPLGGLVQLPKGDLPRGFACHGSP